MIEPDQVEEPITPSVKFTMTPDKGDGMEELSPCSVSPTPSSPFSSASTVPFGDMQGGWDSPGSGRLYASSEPCFSLLRAASISPRMTHLASGIAELSPFTAAGLASASPISACGSHGSLASSSPIPSPVTSPLNRIPLRQGGGGSSRSLNAPNSMMRQSQTSVSPQNLSDSAPLPTSPRPYGESQGYFLSSSFSSLEDCASATTDSSDMRRISEELQRGFNDQIYELPRTAAATSPSLSRYSHLAAPTRSNSDNARLRNRASTMSYEREHVVAPSPTRSRGGTPTASSQRAAAYHNHPKLALNQTRRGSYSQSMPKPKLNESHDKNGQKREPLIPTLQEPLQPSTLSSSSSSPSETPTSLPFLHLNDKNCHRITNHTLKQVFNGEFSHSVPEFYVIDCRSQAEFEAGHIKGAFHSPDPSVAIERFITSCLPQLRAEEGSKVVLIFHCEFSQRRGPQAMEAFRFADRAENTWPNVFYKEIYCLHGGYSELYISHPQLCDPLGYLTEPNKDHRSSSTLRRSQSVSRINLSRSLGNIPSMDEDAQDDYLLASPSNPAKGRYATTDISKYFSQESE